MDFRVKLIIKYNFDLSFSILRYPLRIQKIRWGRERNQTALVKDTRMITEYTGHKKEEKGSKAKS